MTREEKPGSEQEQEPEPELATVRQPYHWPRGPEIRTQGLTQLRIAAIVYCIAVASALIVLLYLMAHGRFP